jgi:prepilin-type N-terminal cleavage/methylation domain-containing protein
MVFHKPQTSRGFSLIEVLIVAAVMALFFGGLLTGIQYSLKLVSENRSKLTALTVVNEYMEYIRSLPYDSVGTVSGIPPGLIPQISTTTLNSIQFTRRVLIEYIDDDADGVGASDNNGITTDYKQAKVVTTWVQNGVTKEVFLITNIIPRSIETDVGGGTLRVNVFDADNQPLPGASVRVWNTTVIPNIDVTRTSDALGIALFGGAPAGPDYQISVTASGYSTDRTYMATTSLPIPTTQPVAVLEADISTTNFFIDQLGNLEIRALLGLVRGSLVESFVDLSGVATSSRVSIFGNALTLSETAGVYAASGTAYLIPMAPTPVVSYDRLLIEQTIPVNTNARVRLYTVSSSTYTLIPDTDLPGNTAGFTADLSLAALSPVTYPSVVVGVELSTTNTAVTPSLDTITLTYRESETLASSRNLTIAGAKILGTLSDFTPVPKLSTSTLTDSNGRARLNQIEWDSYSITTSGQTVREACPAEPVIVSPGDTATVELTFTPATAHSLRVVVVDSGGLPVEGATVNLTQGSTLTETTSVCGQVFFSGLSSETDSILEVVGPSGTVLLNPFAVDGVMVQTITL